MSQRLGVELVNGAVNGPSCWSRLRESRRKVARTALAWLRSCHGRSQRRGAASNCACRELTGGGWLDTVTYQTTSSSRAADAEDPVTNAWLRGTLDGLGAMDSLPIGTDPEHADHSQASAYCRKCWKGATR